MPEESVQQIVKKIFLIIRENNWKEGDYISIQKLGNELSMERGEDRINAISLLISEKYLEDKSDAGLLITKTGYLKSQEI